MSHEIDEKKVAEFVGLAKLIPNWASSTTIDYRWKWGRLDFRFHKRGTDGVMGRFGGGWNWEVGFQAGGKTIIFSLLVATLRITLNKAPL